MHVTNGKMPGVAQEHVVPAHRKGQGAWRPHRNMWDMHVNKGRCMGTGQEHVGHARH